MQKTDLNVSPYYDDFAESDNFHRVLFRPAFSVQARELTQMQSILQNQIERFSSHFFKEGTVVVPGQVGMDTTYSFVKVQTTFTDSGSTTHTVENYRTSLVGVKLTGATSNVVAKVINTVAATTTDDLTLYVKYEYSGTSSGSTTKFTFDNGESLVSDTAISYVSSGTTYTINANTQIGTAAAATATGTGSSASVQKGIFYVRGHFVECAAQTIILDKYTNTPSYRVGFTVTESLSTPEEDTSLLDNATGSTNYAAKGAHRLKYSLTLVAKVLGTADDADFLELMAVSNGVIQSKVRSTDYSVLEETMARRTHDESGDYIVRGFDIDMREHLDSGLNNGLYTAAQGGDSSKVAITLSPGKAYVRGYEIETIAQTVVPLPKARTTAFSQNYPTTFSAGNYVQVENVFGMPDISNFGSTVSPFKEVELRDRRNPVTHLAVAISSTSTHAPSDWVVDSVERLPASGGFFMQIDDEIIKCDSVNSANQQIDVNASGRGWGGTVGATHADDAPVYIWGLDVSTLPTFGAEITGLVGRAKTVGVARTRAFELGSGIESTSVTGAHLRSGVFQHYIFDVRMLAKVTMEAAAKFTATNFVRNGAKVTGSVSGATGIVYIAPQDVQYSLSCTPATTTVCVTANTAGLEAGMGISGTDIPDDTYIVSVTNSTDFVLSQAGTGTTAGNKTIGNAAAATDGEKLVEGITFHLIQTTGTFVATDVLSSNITGDFATSGAIDSIKYYQFNDAHSIHGANTGAKPYTADLCPKDTKVLTGTVSATLNTSVVTGTNTGFNSDLKVGDLIQVDMTGTTKRFEVKKITSDTTLTTVEKFPLAVSNSLITRVRAKIEEQEELVMITKLPKPAIKTLKASTLNNKVDTTLTVRRQETVTLAGGSGSITLPEGESFVSFNADDYVLQVITESTSSMKYPNGTVLFPSTDNSDQCYLNIGTTSLGITLGTGGDSVLKVTFTVQVATSTEKTKTLIPMSSLAVSVASGGIYGTNYQDVEISLNKPDIFKIRGMYQSADSSTAAVPPTMTYNNGTGSTPTSDETFQPGEKITGSNGAIARIISGTYASDGTTRTASFAYLTSKAFTTGITLTSTQNTFANALTTTAVTAGDTDILSNYQIDNGMRDTFYDIGRVARKAGIAAPTGRLLIVFDYFTHGAGDYFSVDSYPQGTSTTSIDYSEIPLYSAQRVDPDTVSPTGEYDLRDSVDFRPRIADYDGTNTVSGSRSISPFSFTMRDFSGGTASLVDIPKTDNTFLASFDYYLPQNASLFLDSDSQFRSVSGGAAENPEKPPVIMDAMKLAEFRLPQYVFDPLDIGVRKMKHRRFTMKDIGKINTRVENLEYYSQLNMLEKDTKSFQIQDGDGLDRFKNGFIVDNFTGHSVGNALHPDYKNSMDMANGMLRPEFFHRSLGLEESVSTDSLRAASGYQKTGDLLTLSYTETTMITQPYASRIENVNPFNVIAWIGSIELSPASDIWRDTNRMPNLIINREGNFDSFVARNDGSALRTVWNEWETFWTGEESTSEAWRDTSWATARAQVPFRRSMETTTTVTTEKDSRTGVRTEIVPRIDYESKGDKVVSTDILPFIRTKDVSFTGRVFKPATRLYAFFDNVDVSEYIKPDIPYANIHSKTTVAITQNVAITAITIGVDPSTLGFDVSAAAGKSVTITDASGANQEVFGYDSTTSTGFVLSSTTPANTHAIGSIIYKTPVEGDPMISSLGGKVTGTFGIPDPNISGNPAFKVGERKFKLTSSSTNAALTGDTQTAGDATYYAKGLLDNIQESIIATRNADVVVSNVNDTRVRTSTRSADRQVGWWDPLAQSFLIDTEGGAFVTSVDCYFNSKSATIPVQCQLRTMVNGYPSATILPFGTAVMEATNVNVSDSASISTTFTFPSPVYLQESVEYCFVIMANTQDYTMWLSHMGELDVGGSRMISDQPYAGVLFKSQNASTWTASQMEDLKFSVKRASFSTTPGTVTLQNSAVDSATLPSNPITTIPASKKIKVKHPNHGMYESTTNNVTVGNLAGTVALTTGTYDLSTLGSFTKVSIAEVGLDHYILDLTGVTNAPGYNFNEAKVTGGSAVSATENYMMDTGKIVLQTLELSGTSITPKIRTTSATSASDTSGVTGGSETSFNLVEYSSAQEIALNENIQFSEPVMVASSINETNEMTGNKSFHTIVTFATEKDNISPVIDVQRMGVIAVQNRLNNINVNTDLFSSATIAASTVFSDEYKTSSASEGDNNAAIYITRKVTLANSSTALKVIFDAIRFNSASIEVYQKTLKSDDTTQFDDIAWLAMSIDKTVSESKNYKDFREYTYEASNLEGYIAFAIKIVMKGTKSTETPLIKDLRAIALAV